MWLTLSLGFLLCAVIGHAILCRLSIRADFVVKSVMVGMPMGILLIAVAVFRFGLAIEAAAAMLLYAFLFELYIFCFTLVSTSVSVSLLLKLADRPRTVGEIESLYSDKSMVDTRVEKMVRTNLLARSPDGFRVTSKSRVLLAGFRTMRFFFRHPSEAETAASNPSKSAHA
jgi:hypothetical protein